MCGSKWRIGQSKADRGEERECREQGGQVATKATVLSLAKTWHPPTYDIEDSEEEDEGVYEVKRVEELEKKGGVVFPRIYILADLNHEGGGAEDHQLGNNLNRTQRM